MLSFLQSSYEQLRSLALRIQSTRKRFFDFTKQLAKSAIYWTSVVSAGLLIASLILHFTGVPIAETAYATNPFSYALNFIQNVIYYVALFPVGAANTIMAYLLDLVVGYPWDPYWFQYTSDTGGFVNVEPVVNGWRIVRDLCNMFFGVILVIIALSTVLGIEQYSARQLLPTFLIMVVLVNFSKSIAGLMTDMATVAMATFGGSIAGNTGAGILATLGLPDLFSFNPTVGGQLAETGVGGTFFALIAITVMMMTSLTLLTALTIVLILRVVMLWFLIVISPVAYMTRILPITKRYSSQWWEVFGRYVILGPLMTFFLWLTLAILLGTAPFAGEQTGQLDAVSGNPLTSGIVGETTGSSSSPTVKETPRSDFSATTPSSIGGFLIATVLLLGSLRMLQELSKEFGKITATVVDTTGNIGKELAGGRFSGRMFYGIGGVTERLGDRLGLGRVTKPVGRGLQYLSGNVLSPQLYGRRMIENLSNSSKKSMEDYEKDYNTFIKGKYEKPAPIRGRERAAMGYEGIRALGMAGVAERLAGTFLGAGSATGEGVWRNTLSAQGVSRGITAALRVAEGKFGKLDKAEIEEEAAAAKANDAANDVNAFQGQMTNEESKFTATERSSEEAAYNAVRDRAKDAEDLQDGSKSDDQVDVNLDDVNVKGVINTHISAMQAARDKAGAAGDNRTRDDINNAISRMQSRLSAGGKVSLSALSALGPANAAAAATYGLSNTVSQDLRSNADTIKESADGQLAEQQAKMQAAGYEFDDSGNITKQGGLKDQGKIDNLRQQIEQAEARKKVADERKNKASTKRKGLENYIRAIDPPQNLDAVAAYEKALSEARDQIKNTDYVDDIKPIFFKAARKGDAATLDAISRHMMDQDEEEALLSDWITEIADADPQFKQQMKENGKAPGVDFDGLENYRFFLERFAKLDKRKATAITSKISSMAVKGNKTALMAAYSSRAGNLRPNDQATREAIVDIIYSGKDTAGLFKLGPDSLTGKRRNDDTGEMEMVLLPAVRQLMRRNATALADRNNFSRWRASTKERLSEPTVIASMRAAGINEVLIKKLEEYRKSIGK